MAVADAATYLPEAYMPPRRRFELVRSILRKKIAVVAILYLVVFYTAGILAPVVATHDPNEQHRTLEEVRQGPSADHWFGTDMTFGLLRGPRNCAGIS